MADETIDNMVNGPPQAKKPEPKKSMLESMLAETGDALRVIGQGTLAVGMPLALMNTVPDAALDIGSWTAGNCAADLTTNIKSGKRHTMGEVAKSSAVASITSLPIHYAYKAINSISLDSIVGYIGKAAAFGGIVFPALLWLYQSVDYVVRNGFKGLGKYLKEHYWSKLKSGWKYILPFSLANIFLVQKYLQIAVGSVLGYVLALSGAPKGELKDSEKKGNAHLLNPINPGYLAEGAGMLYNRLIYGVYTFGKAINDFFKLEVPAAPATAPAAAPAT